MKKCSKCGVTKEFTEFCKDKRSRSGFRGECKACQKAYREANREKIKEYNREHRKANKEKIKVKKREYYESNKEKINEKQREYEEANREEINKKNRAYYKANKENIKVKQREYRNKRFNTDTLFKLSHILRSRIRNSINNGGYSKKTKTHNILGCSFEHLINHLNNNPYGFTYGDSDLDLDHIVPVSTASKELDIIKLNHYTNFQLLPSEYNRNIKRDNKWDRKDFECWLQNNHSFHL